MAWTDTTRKAEAQGGGVTSLNVTLNSTVAGNLVVAGHSSFEGAGNFAAATTYSDGGNTWTESFRTAISGGKQISGLGYSVLTTGGNRTINFDPGTSSYDMSVYVHEFSGPHATPASGTPVTSTGNSTTASTGAMTPADNDVLLIAVDGHATSGTVTENAGSEGFTLSNDHESGTSAEPGSMVFKILSGAPGTPSHSWTIPSGLWAAGIAAFKPAAEAGSFIFQKSRSMQATMRR